MGLGFRRDTAFLLAGWLTCRDRIPQCSPTSNDALNIYLYDIDSHITELCGSRSRYTRIADDHVISGNDPPAVQTVTSALEVDVEKHGLSINRKKKAKNGLKVNPEVQLVHAIAVNHPKCTRINRVYSRS